MAKTKVAIVKEPKNPDEKEIDAIVRKAIELAGGLPDIISPLGDTVLIKPDIVLPRAPGSAVTTDPGVCQDIANMVRETGASPMLHRHS